jgi:xylulokinase
MMFRWFRDNFCQRELMQAMDMKEDVYEFLTTAAACIAPGSEGLLVLPHLMGSGSPEFNVKAKAVFAGISMGMTKAHFTRAIMESVAYMIKRNLEILELKGIKAAEIRVLGGGAKSNLWNQIKADVTNIPICTLQGQETASVGAAILAGVGCSTFESIDAGCNKTVKIKDRFYPTSVGQAGYRKQYAQYKLLSDTLEKFW